MLNLRPNAGFEMLRLNPDLIDMGILFQGHQSIKLFGNMPVGLGVFQLISLLSSSAPSIREDKSLFIIQ